MKSVFIDFSILLNSNLDNLKKEFNLLLKNNQRIYLWSKTISVNKMIAWCTKNNIHDYIWGYREKDSSFYSCVDFVIDPDPKFVQRFGNKGIKGNTLTKID